MWMFIALRFIQGAAGSAGLVISRAVLRDLFSGTELTKFSSKLMLVLGVAPIFAPVAGSQILQFASWKGVFIVLSLIGVAMFIAVYFGLNETLPAQRRSKAGLRNTLRTFGGLMNDRPFMGYAITQGLTLAAMFAYISGSPFILQDIYGMSPQMFSLCFGINGFGLIMASQIAGWLAGLISETAMLVYGLVIASIGGVLLFVMIVAQAGIYFILVPLFIVVSIVGFITTASSSLALQTQAKSAGTASALLGLMSFILGAVVSPLVGLGGGQTAMPLGIVIIASQFSAILCYILLIKRSRKLVPSWIVRESLSRCRTEQADGG
jgi:DHA1 family bicyclomycin/chloramphenicol resistance-like MFS transporter